MIWSAVYLLISNKPLRHLQCCYCSKQGHFTLSPVLLSAAGHRENFSSFYIDYRVSQDQVNLKNQVKWCSLNENNKQIAHVNNILHLDCIPFQVIPPANLTFWCLVVAAAASSLAKPIYTNSDYSNEPSKRMCQPFCGDDQDKGDCSRHLNGDSSL